MNLETYTKLAEVSQQLGNFVDPKPVFQNYIESRLNESDYDEFLQNEEPSDQKTTYYLRLKNATERNSKNRGLKMCLFNSNIFKEKIVEPGTSLIEFTPLLRVIGFNNDNCCECGKYLVDIGDMGNPEDKTSIDLLQEKVNIQQEPVYRCNACHFRVFCSEECEVVAKLKWHTIECSFIQFMKSELVVSNNEENPFTSEAETSQTYEKVVMLILTTFRLLIMLSAGDEIDCDLISNMSDHFELYNKYTNESVVDVEEHGILFKETIDTFRPVIKNFFQLHESRLRKEHPNTGLESINDTGIIRLFLIVFVNVSSLMDYFNNNLGLMFDPIFSMINHSCEPNCTLVWKDKCKILIKTTKKLKAATELTLNYIPIYVPKNMRQKQLMSSFFFKCECHKCAFSDKKFDSMLPLNCKYCGQNNKGFLLENLEVYNSLPKVDRKVICNNCENVIDAELVFNKYIKILKYFSMLNPEIKKMEDLSCWSVASYNVLEMNTLLRNSGVALLKECFEDVPLKSWPMSMLIGIVKVGLQNTEPYSLNVLRMTYLSNFLIENMFEKKSVFKTVIGSSIYDLAVASADFLFDQYLINKSKTDIRLISIIGWATFSLCILSFKHLAIRFDNGEAQIEDSIEKAQRDMVQLSKEILRLLKHITKEQDFSFSQELFEMHIDEFEKYMGCGCNSQLDTVVLPLDESDYVRFGVVKNTSETVSFAGFLHAVHSVAEKDTEKVSEHCGQSSKSRLLFVKPEWLSRL